MFKKAILESKFEKFKKSILMIKNNLCFYKKNNQSANNFDYFDISDDITIKYYTDGYYNTNKFWEVKIIYKNKEVISFNGHNTIELLTESPVEGIKLIIEEILEYMKVHKEIFDKTSQKYDKRKIEFIKLW